ncbi:MAG: Coq4 family protein [Cyanobacteria bacterium J06621_11]
MNTPIVDADYLRQLPEGTFGRKWIDTMDRAGLVPFSAGSRRQQLHDGVHVLAGYQTDPLGEVEVQAFLAGAKFRALHGVMLTQMVVAVALFKPMALRMGRHFGLSMVMKQVMAAYRRGQKARLDLDRWQPEQVWELPYSEVQAMFGLS